MMSGEFYPVTKLMADTGHNIDWSDYFPGIANYYSASNGELFSMPFNSSTRSITGTRPRSRRPA